MPTAIEKFTLLTRGTFPPASTVCLNFGALLLRQIHSAGGLALPSLALLSLALLSLV